MRRSLAIFRHEGRLIRSELLSMSQMIVMPLVMMAFLIPVAKSTLVAQGYKGVNGSEQVVPGMAVMFACFIGGQAAFLFFREHAYGTWERLRASPARPMEIMLGKALSPVFIVLVQQVVLVIAGMVLFGLRIKGLPLTLIPVVVAYAFALVALGLVLAAFCKSSQQVNLISGILAMVLSGMGGAFVPLASLPAGARAVAPITPTYWAMEGYRSVILDGAGLLGVAKPVLVLTGLGVALAIITLTRFRFEETKIVVG